jgi:hypothetical protein
MAKARGTFVVPRGFDPEAKRFATIVNDSIAQIKGEKGDPLDAAVTFRDLIDTGIAKRNIRINADGKIVGTNSNQIVIGEEEVLDIPPPPTGVSADGAFQNIIIEWDIPTFFGFSHAEVWASSTNSFASRVFVGQTTAAVFNHAVGTGQTRYYWIRFVNIQDIPGPFNSTSGTAGTTALIDTQEIADGLITAAKLVDGAVTEVKIATDAVTNAKIAVNAIQGDVIAASAITETKISSNAISSAKIQANAIIAGKIATNAIVAGNIQSNAVTADKIQANAVNADKIAANSVTAAKMVAGTITAASGIIGDLAISSAKIIDGAILRAKIADAAIDDAKIANLSATKITSDLIDTARINVTGLINAGGLIVSSDLSTNGATVIHGGNIQTNTIQASSLTITPVVAGGSAADINANVTTINGGKITTNSITADRINVTDLALEFTAATVSGATLGAWQNNTMRLLKVADIGTEAGVYHIMCRVFGSSGQVKTLSIVAGDGTFGSGSSFELRSDFAYTDGTQPTIPTADQGYAQYHSGQSQYWSAIDRFDSANEMVQKDFIVRKVSSTSRTLRLYILAQGDGSNRYLSNVQYGVYRFSEI